MFKITNRIVRSHKKRTKEVKGLVIHYISAVNIDPDDPYNIDEIINIFNTYGVSADYLVGRDGTIFRLVPEDHYSYHAGVSVFPDGSHSLTGSGKKTVNEISIGIELVGYYNIQYTEEQYNSLKELTLYLKEKHPTLSFDHIYGHEHVAIPLGRKKDPGPSFDWSKYINLLKNPEIKINEPPKKLNILDLIKKFLLQFLNK